MCVFECQSVVNSIERGHACWKIRFKTEVCTWSQFPTEAMQWIKEVEMVDSVDDLRSSSSIRSISMPDFEVLDARIASALNKIIHNSHFKRRISLEEQKALKQDRFLRGRQIAYLIYDYFRVTRVHDSVENKADLFTISLRNDDIQEFDSKWDGILLSMTKIPPDEGLYKLRTRESEKLKTVLELYDLEIHQKKIGPDYHRLKTVVKRSIKQDILNKNFGDRNGNYERNAVVKNPGTKQRARRILGDCWQWESNGQCSKGDNCSFRHDMNKRGKSSPSNPSPNSFMRQNERKSSRTRSPRGKSPSGRMSRWPCKDYLKGTCNNSFCEKWHPPECLFYGTKSGCRFGEKCSYAHRQVDEQPTKRLRRMMTKVLWLYWRKVIGKKEDLLPTNVTIDQGNLMRGVIRSWDKNHRNVDHLMHDNWVAYFKTWRRRSLFSGSAQTCGNQCNVWNSQRLLHDTLKFETKILRSDIFAQVNLMSVAPTLQNLRIGLRRRQSGKSKVPAKQRGSWPKMCWN